MLFNTKLYSLILSYKVISKAAKQKQSYKAIFKAAKEK